MIGSSNADSSSFGLPFGEICSAGTTAVNKCKVNGETWYVAQCNGYLIFGGHDPYSGYAYVRIGSSTSNYFQSNVFGNDINGNTKASGTYIPVKKGQYFYALGLENTNSTEDNWFIGFVVNGTKYPLNIGHGVWFVPADSGDISLSAYFTTA